MQEWLLGTWTEMGVCVMEIDGHQSLGPCRGCAVGHVRGLGPDS